MQRHVDFVTTRGGAAVSGASVLVKTYPAGATATIYSDDGVTATTNPLTTDANGQFSFYAEDGRYTLVISKTGVITQQTLTDSVLLLDPDDDEASIDSADVFFIPSGSGAIAGDAQDALRLSVHTSQYNTQGNYETARDALTGTTGVNNLDVSGNLVVTGTITGTVAGNIAESLIDAKGDLIAGTAADTAGRLAAGTNEYRLVADSAQTAGLKYVPDTTNYAVAAKGDLLVGTAADTVAAVTVGANNTVLAAASGQASGVAWTDPNTLISAASDIVAGKIEIATQAEQETGTDTTLAVTPGRQKFHPSAAKAWVHFNGTGTVAVLSSYNVASITDGGVGAYTVNLTTAFSATNQTAVASCFLSGAALIARVISVGTSTIGISTVTSATTDTDASYVAVVAYGDQ